MSLRKALHLAGQIEATTDPWQQYLLNLQLKASLQYLEEEE